MTIKMTDTAAFVAIGAATIELHLGPATATSHLPSPS